MEIQDFQKEAIVAAEAEGLSDDPRIRVIQLRWFVAGAIWAKNHHNKL